MGIREQKIGFSKEYADNVQHHLNSGTRGMFITYRTQEYEVLFDDGVKIRMNVNYHDEICDISYTLFKDGVKVRKKVGKKTLLGSESFVIDDMVYVVNVGLKPVLEVRETLYIHPDICEQVQEFLHFGYRKDGEGKMGVFEFSHEFGDGIELFIDINLENGQPAIHSTLMHGESDVEDAYHSRFLGVYETEFDNTRWILDVVAA